MISEEKQKALEAALGNIEKQFGKGSVMKLGDSSSHMQVEAVPTGCLSLDIALGVGGVPKGRIVEIYGPESSGKTTVALHMVAEVQKRGGIAGFIDAEHALDPVYAKNIGVDIDNLYISQPDNGEQALEITETMVRSGAVDIVIVDSVAALVPKAEIEGDMGDSHVGLQARLMSQALRKLTAVISKSNCVVIFINQLREKVGVMFGNPETTTGGRALKFYASVRMDVRRVETLKQGGEMVGNHTRVKVVKNKVAPPFKQANMACHEGLLGMACTNSEAIMVPTFGRKAMLGSNPIAVSMPADPYPFFFDCSTTVVTRGKLEMYNKMGKPLPDGWALDKNGHASNNAPDVLANIVAKKGGGIMPLGGNEEVSGSHKGYGYGMLCELFSSILSMGVTSDKCCTFPDKTGICHGFMAINPAAFGDPDAIRKHFSEYLEALRESPKADGQERIYTHGEKEVAAEKDRKENGIPVNDNTLVELADLCSYLKLDFGSYFEGYELPKDSKFFNGNY